MVLIESMELLSEYDFKIAATASELKQALALRLQVFSQEQKFPESSEIDEYDPASAHFLLLRRRDTVPVGTVRLTPYPRRAVQGDEDISQTVNQNESSIVTSAGGPESSAGGLPIFGPKEGSKASMTKTKGTPAHASDDQAFLHEFPLGAPLDRAELMERFAQRVSKKTIPFEEEEKHAPHIRGAKLSRMAVLKTERGKGLGALIVRNAEIWLKNILSRIQSVDIPSEPIGIVISSQMHAVPFYEKLGFEKTGEPYDEEGAPHSWCIKQIAGVEK